jgi:predicted metal-dependent peptidase
MTATDKAAYDKLVGARVNLLLDHYFFGRLAMNLKLVEHLGIPTLAVDGKHIFYNPQFVHSLSRDLTLSGFVHEIMHCVQQHFLRRGSRDARVWNRAGDYVINLILKDAGFRIGEGWLLDEKYRDMSTEHVYDLLQQEKQDGSGSGPGPGQPGGSFDDVIDGALSEGERTEQSMEWTTAVEQAAQGAKALGKLPDSLARFLKECEAPQVSWREVLQRFITDRSASDYSWMRPSKRMMAHGYFLPSLHSEEMGCLVDVIDVSGSIDIPTLAAFGAEVKAAWMAARPARTLNIYCGHLVGHIDDMARGDEMAEFVDHPEGGRSTDFRPPFDWLEEQDIVPSCLVYLTDGYGPFPAEPPPYPVLWCMTTDVQPPWGEVVRIRI